MDIQRLNRGIYDTKIQKFTKRYVNVLGVFHRRGCCRFDSAQLRVRNDKAQHSGEAACAADFDNHVPNRRSDCNNRNHSQHRWNCQRYWRWDGGPCQRVGGRRGDLKRGHGDDRLELYMDARHAWTGEDQKSRGQQQRKRAGSSDGDYRYYRCWRDVDCPGPWSDPNRHVENISPNNEVVGAIHTVAAHPTDANILYVGGVNGGIWRTGNATAASPHWTPLTDNLRSLSIGALEFDPTDPTRRTLVAGIGRIFSNFRSYVGPLTGILRTTDGGDNWTQIKSSQFLVNQHITGVAARGATLLATAFVAGVIRSTDGGVSWVQVSGGNGLTFGPVFDLASDPNNLNRFYVTVLTSGISTDFP